MKHPHDRPASSAESQVQDYQPVERVHHKGVRRPGKESPEPARRRNKKADPEYGSTFGPGAETGTR
jgi:hypothetical protein